MVFIASCKKDSNLERRPKTVTDFEKIMANDLNINNLVNVTNQLVEMRSELKKQEYYYLNGKINQKPDSEVISDIESLKDKQSILKTFNKYFKNNNSQILDLVEKQLFYLNLFKKEYPEISKLNKVQIEKLISNIIKRAQIRQNPLIKSLYSQSSPLNPLSVAASSEDCIYDYMESSQICDLAYGVALGIIWGDFLLASAVTTAGTAGVGPLVALGGALIRTAGALILYDSCYEIATNSFSRCSGINISL